ncbi:MAG: aldehyde ferredoxin oxidoreductase N-terminal domain-containing protein [Thermoleophilia bacterium]
MSGGWAGRLLRVDLTTRRIVTEPTDRYLAYVGGTGIAARIYLDEVDPGTGPFDPANLLILMTGPLAGTPSPTSGRATFYGKSPVGHPDPVCRPSSIGGSLGAELKYAGFDGVIIGGASLTPVYLWVQDGAAELRDAADLWGLDTFETQRTLLRRHDRRAAVASIGPSGENLGRLAAIVHGTGFASGLSGFGAVMGSKKLKALGVRGTGAVDVADPARLLAAVRRGTEQVYRADDPPRMTGSRGSGRAYGGAEEFVARYSVGVLACHACPVACQGVFRVPGSPLGADSCAWPHALGVAEFPRGVEGWKAVWDVNTLVNRLGLSSYEVTEGYAFVVRLRDAGLIDEQSSGLPLRGDPRELVKALAHQIAHRRGLGDCLAEGLPRAAEQIGGAARHLVSSRGWPILLPSDDARTNGTMALLPTVGAFVPYNDGWSLWGYYGGSIHLPLSDRRETLAAAEIARVTERVLGDARALDASTLGGKAEAVRRAQSYRMLADSIGFCTWVLPLDCGYYAGDLAGDEEVLAELYSAVTGVETDQGGLLRLGERIATLQRLQGIRQGYHSREKDLSALDAKVFGEPHSESPFPGGVVDLAGLGAELERYYELCGWDARTGVPLASTLHRLGMDDVADRLPA